MNSELAPRDPAEAQVIAAVGFFEQAIAQTERAIELLSLHDGAGKASVTAFLHDLPLQGCQLQNKMHDAGRKIVALTPSDQGRRTDLSTGVDKLPLTRDQLYQLRRVYSDLDDGEYARLKAEAVENLVHDAGRKIADTPKGTKWDINPHFPYQL